MVYNEEMVYLKKNRAELMDELLSIMNANIEAVEECREIERTFNEAKTAISTTKMSDSELDDYAVLINVLTYKLQVLEEQKLKRDKRREEIVKQVLYIDELCS